MLPFLYTHSPVDPEKFIVCAQCPLNGAYDGGAHEVYHRDSALSIVSLAFSHSLSHKHCLSFQVVLCENNIPNSKYAAGVITHELIHAFDNCRAKVNFLDPRHLACTEVCGGCRISMRCSHIYSLLLPHFNQIRASSLSGDCFWTKETFSRLNFGWKKHHQVCALNLTWGKVFDKS